MSAEGSSRVLIVDDDGLVAKAIGRYLSSHGFLVDTRGSGDLALRALEESFYDALLVDVNMPGVDGFGVLEGAQKLAEPPATIMMTGRADVKLAVTAMRRGAADFLEKPVEMSDLVTRLERAIENMRMRRKLAVLEEDALRRTRIVSPPLEVVTTQLVPERGPRDPQDLRGARP